MIRQFWWSSCFLALASLACDAGVSVYYKNTADFPVTTFRAPPDQPIMQDVRLQAREEMVTSWLTNNPEQLRMKVAAQNEAGQLVFCRVYTYKDLIRDKTFAVVIVPSENSC